MGPGEREWVPGLQKTKTEVRDEQAGNNGSSAGSSINSSLQCFDQMV